MNMSSSLKEAISMLDELTELEEFENLNRSVARCAFKMAKIFEEEGFSRDEAVLIVTQNLPKAG